MKLNPGTLCIVNRYPVQRVAGACAVLVVVAVAVVFMTAAAFAGQLNRGSTVTNVRPPKSPKSALKRGESVPLTFFRDDTATSKKPPAIPKVTPKYFMAQPETDEELPPQSK